MWAMIPMFRTRSIGVWTKAFMTSTPAQRTCSLLSLPTEVRERLVGVRHLVRVLALLDRATAILRSVEDLARQTFTHRPLAALHGVVDDPAHPEGRAALRTNLDRHLEGRAAYAARLHLDARLHVLEGLL